MAKKINWKALIVSLVISLGAGALAAFLTRGNQDIYEAINRPPLAPPGFLFPSVWTILYTLMGISAYLVFMSTSNKKKDALFMYIIQLLLNVMWSLIFFNMREFLLAFLWIVVLWIAIYTMIRLFLEVDKVAGWLQIPYLVWVSFATYLNLAIYYLN